MARDFAGGRLTVSDAAPIDQTGTAFTIAVWANPDTTGAFRSLAGKRGDDTPFVQYQLGMNNANVFVHANTDSVAGGSVATGSWQHLAGVKDGTGAAALRAYLNGVEVANATSNLSIPDRSDALEIGDDTRSTTWGAYDGKLAELAIWSAALTVAELEILAKGFSPLLVRPQSLDFYLPMLGNASPEPDVVGGLTATVTATADKSDHPRIIMPRSAIYLP